MAKRAKRFGKYVLLHRIAVGGMAEIFLARQKGLEGFEKLISIKRIRTHLSSQPNFVRMFLNEAKLAAQLTHPNIVQIHDLGKVSDAYFIAMEYVSGRDMSRIIPHANRKEIQFPMVYALKIASMALEGLYHAHEKTDSFGNPLGIVHRDVTPENIIVAFNGTVKLADFGIAKANTQLVETKAGEIKGKLSYMSPEQAMGHQLDSRSDLFSLGSILYEWITGTKLFTGENEMAILNAIIKGKIYPPGYFKKDLPEEISTILMKALEKDREKRYQSASDMKHDIDKYLSKSEFNPSSIHLSNFMKQLFDTEIEQEKVMLRDTREMDVEMTQTGPIAKKGMSAHEGEMTEALNLDSADFAELSMPNPGTEESEEELIASLVSDDADASLLSLTLSENEMKVLGELAQRKGKSVRDIAMEIIQNQVRWLG